jgi:hypothetical protein
MYFYSKMIQQIDSGFVTGERYYVKLREGFFKDLIFTKHAYSKTGLWFDDLDEHYGYLLHSNQIKVYRYVSDEEYYTKVKEKYDDKCLNTILKRLVNETFEW